VGHNGRSSQQQDPTGKTASCTCQLGHANDRQDQEKRADSVQPRTGHDRVVPERVVDKQLLRGERRGRPGDHEMADQRKCADKARHGHQLRRDAI